MGSEQRAVVKAAASRSFFIRTRGVQSSHIVAEADGASQGLTGTTEFEQGAELPLHWHNCEETVVILEGEALFEAGTDVYDLVTGDATWTPPGLAHRFTNRGRGPTRILWIYGSVTATRTLAATGETSRISAERSG